MVTRLLIAAAFLALPVAAQAQEAPETPPVRVRSVIVYGDEACPKPESPDEIVVCANGGDSAFRIPRRFRELPDEGPASQSWVNRVEMIEEVNRAGLPGSCSPIGTGGWTGCTRQEIRRWAQERVEREARENREQAPD